MNTVCSVLTPPGRGAVAVVAVAGPQATLAVNQFFYAKNRRPLAEQSIARIVYGTWSTTGEDLVVCRLAADLVEIHCHGGSQAVGTVTSDLRQASCVEISWQDWLAREGGDSLKTEAQIGLAQAASARTAAILLDQFHGALERELTAIRGLLANDAVAAQQRLTALLSTAELGSHLTRSWQVVIAGKPNVGKSSLINALVGYQRAIVFDQPGTTRDVVTAATVIDGWPVTLSDTAGLHEATDELETAGIELARERLATADLVVWVLDATEIEPNALASGEGVINVKSAIPEASACGSALTLPAKQLLVLNKIDRVNEWAGSAGVIATSATMGVGIDELLAAISAALVPEVPPRGAAVLFTERQRVGVAEALAEYERGDVAAVGRLLERISR